LEASAALHEFVSEFGHFVIHLFLGPLRPSPPRGRKTTNSKRAALR